MDPAEESKTFQENQSSEYRGQVKIEHPKVASWPKIILTVVVVSISVTIIAGAYWWFFIKTEISSTELVKVTAPSKQSTPSVQKDQIANWKTYENSTLGFQMKHPLHITVRAQKALPGLRYFPVEGTNKNPHTIATFLQENPDFNPSEFPGEDFGPNILKGLLTYDLWIEVGNIIVDAPVDLKELAEAYKEKEKPSPGSFPNNLESEPGVIVPVTVGGKSGYKISRLLGNVEDMVFLPGKNTNEIIYIEATILVYTSLDETPGAFGNKIVEEPEPFSPRYEENKKLFDLMLSTFKFLD